MKSPISAALLAAALPLLAGRADLAQVQSVYVLSMSNGLDQYITNRLTADSIYQVVTDPKRADAVLTDSVGAGFERRMEEMFPPDKPKETEEESEAKKKETSRERAEREAAEMESRREKMAPISTWSRGRGNIFLVDLKTRRVIWSVYERPRRFVPDELDKTAGRIVSRLKKDLSGKGGGQP